MNCLTYGAIKLRMRNVRDLIIQNPSEWTSLKKIKGTDFIINNRSMGNLYQQHPSQGTRLIFVFPGKLMGTALKNTRQEIGVTVSVYGLAL